MPNPAFEKLQCSYRSLPSNCVATRLAAAKYWQDNMLLLIVPSPSLQLHISVSAEKVKLNLDCQEVAEKPIKEANNITLDGYEVLGKLAKSAGGKRQSATVSEKDAGEEHKGLEERLSKG